MNGYARTQDPEDIEFTLTLTASLGKWKTIREKLGEGVWSDESANLRRLIDDIVTQAEQVFWPAIKD